MNLTEKFINEISRIEDPLIFLGLAHGFHIELVEGEENRSFEVLLGELLDHFNALSRKGKKQLIKLIRDARQGE